MKPTNLALDPGRRTEFVCGCAATTLIISPLAFCFLYHQVTGTKSSIGPAALFAVIATLAVTFWALRAKPSRFALGFIFVAMPLIIALVALWRRAYLMIG